MKANQTKMQLRSLMRSLDSDKSGIVKEEAFFTILGLHGITLTEKDKAKLRQEHSKAGKINFKDALQTVNVDLESAILREQNWKVAQGEKKGGDGASNAVLTHLSRMSLDEFK